MDNGFFGRLFDLNGDGELDVFESYLDYKAFEEAILGGSDDDSDNDEA